jgi:hypothetical protein
MAAQSLAEPRTTPRLPGDFVLGCGVPAPEQTSGKACAGAGSELSCQLCPESPTYWRREQPEGATRA